MYLSADGIAKLAFSVVLAGLPWPRQGRVRVLIGHVAVSVALLVGLYFGRGWLLEALYALVPGGTVAGVRLWWERAKQRQAETLRRATEYVDTESIPEPRPVTGLVSAILIGVFTAGWIMLTPTLFFYALGAALGSALDPQNPHSTEAERYSLWFLLSAIGFPSLAMITAMASKRRVATALFGVLLVLIMAGCAAYAFAQGWIR